MWRIYIYNFSFVSPPSFLPSVVYTVHTYCTDTHDCCHDTHDFCIGATGRLREAMFIISECFDEDIRRSSRSYSQWPKMLAVMVMDAPIYLHFHFVSFAFVNAMFRSLSAPDAYIRQNEQFWHDDSTRTHTHKQIHTVLNLDVLHPLYVLTMRITSAQTYVSIYLFVIRPPTHLTPTSRRQLDNNNVIIGM